MFGSIPIFGNSENKIDNQGRLIIPSFSDVEENDPLIIQKGNGNFYIIINCAKIEEKIKKLKSIGDDDKIDILTSSIVAFVKVDKQRRISFRFDKDFAVDHKVFIHGNYDSLQIFPSKEHYKQYINTLKKSH